MTEVNLESEKLNEPSYNESQIKEDKAYISKKYGIAIEELEKYLGRPPKTYVDFPNNKNLIRFIYKTYNKIFPTTFFWFSQYDA